MDESSLAIIQTLPFVTDCPPAATQYTTNQSNFANINHSDINDDSDWYLHNNTNNNNNNNNYTNEINFNNNINKNTPSNDNTNINHHLLLYRTYIPTNNNIKTKQQQFFKLLNNITNNFQSCWIITLPIIYK